ncbi:hypothetical protein U7230_10110 [Carboxydochorda subterranea]|uniref:Cytidylate kinase n=1 Tax=Carboxydichorda subterranea TaxID=3109565 RepID=A0ABZ1BUF8_9FIRM|nr:hypothetical protein [Limnochorda sp. L945t]WRP16450.1 hypothetical protein U7230_10110 [Limnochorda sp. L945t]
MTSVLLAGLRGSLVERTAAVIAARTGWRIEAGRFQAIPGQGRPAESAIHLGWPLPGSQETPAESGARLLRVLLTASWQTRVRRIAVEQGVDEVMAAGLAAAEERELDEKARLSGWERAEAPGRFDLVINTDRVPAEKAASIIVAALRGGRRARRRRPSVERPPAPAPTPAVADAVHPRPAGSPPRVAQLPAAAGLAHDGLAPVVEGTAVTLSPQGRPLPIRHDRPAGAGRPAFAHPSEEEFARMLDFYQVRWEYEPITFPLEWDEQGRITSAFTPDFYLPEYQLYVELTTMKQSLVTRKNRKLRLLKQLYPDVNIKIFYGRDFERLLHKFGKEPLAQAAATPPVSVAPSAPAPPTVPSGTAAAATALPAAAGAAQGEASPEVAAAGEPGAPSRSRTGAAARRRPRRRRSTGTRRSTSAASRKRAQEAREEEEAALATLPVSERPGHQEGEGAR